MLKTSAKAVFHHGVGNKGVVEDRYAVDWVEDQKLLGHSHVVLKCDSENAIIKFPHDTIIDTRTTVKLEEPEVQVTFQTAR